MSASRLSWFRQAGIATARQLLALWHRLLNNFKFSEPCSGMGDGNLPRIIAAEAGDIARANLYRPQRWFPLRLDNFCRAWVFHCNLRRWFWHYAWRQANARAISMALVGINAACIIHSGAGSIANFVITEESIFKKCWVLRLGPVDPARSGWRPK
jgi:hypothetical protein